MIAATLLALAAIQANQAEPAQPAQPAGIMRTDLQQRDLSIAGWQAIQTRVDLEPGAVAPRHMHPGEEIVYVLKGTIEYRLDGQPRVILKPGDVLFIPYGKPHEAVNVGLEQASELATYVVEKDKPVVTLVP